MKINSACLRLAAFAFAVSMVALAGPAARAFTVDEQSSTNFDGSSKFADPDRQVENFGRAGTGSQGSGPSFQFGGAPSHSQDFTNPVMRPLNPWAIGNGHNN